MNSTRYMEQVLYKPNRNSCQMIVFIHGILESYKQFRALAQLAEHEGYATCLLLLPGHGGSSREFAKTSYKEWIRYTSRQIAELASWYDEIILVGHSMGALLAICEAMNPFNRIKSLFLINPPLGIHIWPRVIKSAISIKMGHVGNSRPYTQAEYHAMGVEPLRLRDTIGWINRYSELIAIIYYTRKQILKLNLPMYVVLAEKDEFVSRKSAKYFKGYKGKLQKLYLADSGHFCYRHSDLVRLEKFYLRFIREVNTKN